MTAISRSAVRLWMVPAGTNPSALSASVWTTSNTLGFIPGIIKEYNRSGGDADVESDPVFGGFVDKEKPRSQFELELTLVPAIEASAFDFENIALARDSGTTTIFTSAGIGSDRAFFVQKAVGSSFKSLGYNNCSITVHSATHSADDNEEQTLTLKFAPTTEEGRPNLQKGDVAVTSLLAWSALSASTV